MNGNINPERSFSSTRHFIYSLHEKNKSCPFLRCLFHFFIFQTVDMTSRKFIEPMLDYSNNKEFIGFQYTDVKGSPYFSDKWMKGKVLLNDKDWVDNLQLKFDQYNNHFIVN